MGELAIDTTDKNEPVHPLVKALASRLEVEGDQVVITENSSELFFRALSELELPERKKVALHLMAFALRCRTSLEDHTDRLCESVLEILTEIRDDTQDAVSMFEDNDTEIVHLSEMRKNHSALAAGLEPPDGATVKFSPDPDWMKSD